MLVLSEDPPAMSGGDTRARLRAHAERLRQATAVSRVDVHRLAAPGGVDPWSNWLVELEGASSDLIVVEAALDELLCDLRLLGTDPQLLVVREEAA